MKKYRLNRFTLIELLAAMAVFSILLVVSLRLFSGAQQLWLRSEQKTNTFADARIAMEFVAGRMQTLVYYSESPFYISRESGENEVWFSSRMPLGNSAANRLRFFRFYVVDPTDDDNLDAGKLMMRVYQGRNDKKFWSVMPPYGDDKNYYFDNADQAFDHVEDEIAGNDFEEDDLIEIIENVVELKLKWYNAEFDPKDGVNESDWNLEEYTGDSQKTPPFLVEVEISLIDSLENFKKWQAAASQTEKDEIFAQYGYTFRRAVQLGKRSAEE